MAKKGLQPPGRARGFMGFQGGDDWRLELAPLRRIKGKERERVKGGEGRAGEGGGGGGSVATSLAYDVATRKEGLCPRWWACRRVPDASWMVSSTLMP